MSVTKRKPDDRLSLEQLFVNTFLPLLPNAVRWGFKHYHYHPDQDEIEDVCQQISLLLIANNYRRLRSFDSLKSAPKTWLEAVATHYINRYLKRRRLVLSLVKTIPETSTSQSELEDEQILVERLGAMQTVLRKLSPRERQVLRLRYEEDLSMSEIARQMKIKVGTARTLKRDALAKLRKLMIVQLKS